MLEVRASRVTLKIDRALKICGQTEMDLRKVYDQYALQDL
jgi:hypothetical protein